MSIVIPAYNEQDAIGDTLVNVSAARREILGKTDIREVEIIVVSDGSRDATESIVRDFSEKEEIKLVVFPENRGYGAAIKEGFRVSKGNYVGFFDADNTCDPLFFIDLYGMLQRENAQIALGSRVHSASKMPLVRRIGNRIYATIINLLWRTRITDSASGMRLLRKEVLDKVYPLPDGLHFTPIMTCKALSISGIKIAESPMPYSERSGRSKLSVVKDGWRFLMTIFEMGVSYRPFVLFGTLGIAFFLIAVAYGLPCVAYYVRNRSIPDDMIYRIIAVITGVTVGSILFFINMVMKDFIAYAKGESLTFEGTQNRVLKFIAEPRNVMLAGIFLIALSVLLNAGSLWEYITTATISRHWIYTLVGAFLFIEGTIVFVFGVAQHIIHVYKKKF